MKLLAIMGSPRKGRATDRLVNQAIKGALSCNPDLRVAKLNLIDYNIKHCKNCLCCRDSKEQQDFIPCVIQDDMEQIYPHVIDSDLLIFGTPVHMGYAPALMMQFLERICWTFAKPEKDYLLMDKCPMPRSSKKRKSVCIVTSGIVKPMFRRFCDQASPLIKQTVADSLNAKTVGDLYAGAIELRGHEYYQNKAFKLGAKLSS